MAEGIGHYENILAEIYEKIRDHHPLSLDEKLDFYLASYRINLIKYDVERDPELRFHFIIQASRDYRKVRKFEEKLGLN